MKVKMAIRLSADLLQAIDRAKGGQSRSSIIEVALLDFLAQRRCRRRDAQDLKILNENSDRLNSEAEDVLTYQSRN